MPPNRNPDDDATAPEAMMPFINARLDDLLRGPSIDSPSTTSEFMSAGKTLVGFFI